MRVYWLILGVLGVWRVTHLLEAEDGPWDAMVRMRHQLGRGVVGRLFDCFYCLSLWVAMPFAWLIGASTAERFLLWLALSGGAIVVERLMDRPAATPPYWKEEDSDALLRKDASDDKPGESAGGERRH